MCPPFLGLAMASTTGMLVVLGNGREQPLESFAANLWERGFVVSLKACASYRMLSLVVGFGLRGDGTGMVLPWYWSIIQTDTNG